MQKGSVTAGVSLTRKLKGQFEAIARSRGMSLSSLFKLAISFYITMDPEFLSMTFKLSEDLDEPWGWVCERLALSHLASMAAEEELAGGVIPRALMEFVPGLGATAFYDNLKDNIIRQAQADEKLAERMTEPNKYRKEPDDTIEELSRREAIAQSSNPELMEYSLEVDKLLHQIGRRYGEKRRKEIRMKQLEIERSGDKPAALKFLQAQLEK